MAVVNLKLIRTNQGFSQLELASCAKVSLNAVYRLETANSQDTLDNLKIGTVRKIARALDVKVSVVLGF